MWRSRSQRLTSGRAARSRSASAKCSPAAVLGGWVVMGRAPSGQGPVVVIASRDRAAFSDKVIAAAPHAWNPSTPANTGGSTSLGPSQLKSGRSAVRSRPWPQTESSGFWGLRAIENDLGRPAPGALVSVLVSFRAAAAAFNATSRLSSPVRRALTSHHMRRRSHFDGTLTAVRRDLGTKRPWVQIPPPRPPPRP
jgi:hypothetical protein